MQTYRGKKLLKVSHLRWQRPFPIRDTTERYLILLALVLQLCSAELVAIHTQLLTEMFLMRQGCFFLNQVNLSGINLVEEELVICQQHHLCSVPFQGKLARPQHPWSESQAVKIWIRKITGPEAESCSAASSTNQVSLCILCINTHSNWWGWLNCASPPEDGKQSCLVQHRLSKLEVSLCLFYSSYLQRRF